MEAKAVLFFFFFSPEEVCQPWGTSEQRSSTAGILRLLIKRIASNSEFRLATLFALFINLSANSHIKISKLPAALWHAVIQYSTSVMQIHAQFQDEVKQCCCTQVSATLIHSLVQLTVQGYLRCLCQCENAYRRKEEEQNHLYWWLHGFTLAKSKFLWTYE